MSWQQTVERLARLGYSCKGVVYVVIGLLAAATAAGRGKITDRQGAFDFILDEPSGRVGIFIIAVGLIGYAIWRVSGGIADSEGRGSDAKGLAIRAGSIGRGVVYGWIAVELIRRLMHQAGPGKSSDSQARHWTSRAMDKPFGRWIVAIAGLCVIGYCAWQFYCAIQGKFPKKLRTRSMPPWLITTSRLGLGARAIILGVVGGSLVEAAIHHSASRARGTSGALRWVAGEPFGGVLLVAAGLGLAAYGVYAFANARYRQIQAT